MTSMKIHVAHFVLILVIVAASFFGLCFILCAMSKRSVQDFFIPSKESTSQKLSHHSNSAFSIATNGELLNTNWIGSLPGSSAKIRFKNSIVNIELRTSKTVHIASGSLESQKNVHLFQLHIDKTYIEEHSVGNKVTCQCKGNKFLATLVISDSHSFPEDGEISLQVN